MRILHIAPLIEPLTEPPPGGAELCVSLLAEAQARAGHEVGVAALPSSTLPRGVALINVESAVGGQTPRGSILSPLRPSEEVFEAKISEAQLAVEYRAFETVRCLLRDASFDIVHNHSYDFYPLFALQRELPRVRLFHTLHMPPCVKFITEALAECRFLANYCTVSYAMQSLYQRDTCRTFQVIYNGLPLDEIVSEPIAETNSNAPFLYAARISPEKGLHLAIDLVCHNWQEKLTVMGRIYDNDYFNAQIAPRLASAQIDYRGHCSRAEVLAEMGRSRALVLPLQWDEPFGYVFIEALASGCPVVTYNRGAAAELIAHNVTGILARDLTDLTTAAQRIRDIDRQRCRNSVGVRFSTQTMMQRYLEAYKDVIANQSI